MVDVLVMQVAGPDDHLARLAIIKMMQVQAFCALAAQDFAHGRDFELAAL